MSNIDEFNFSNLTRFMEQPNEKQSLIAHLHEKYPSLCGRTYALMAGMFNASIAISTKFIDKGIPFQIMGVWQMTTALVLACLFNRDQSPYSSEPAVNLGLFMRGLFGSLVSLFFNFAAQHLPSSKFIVLVNTSSIFVVIIAPFVLKEYPTRFILSMVVFSFLGIILLVDPSMLLPASWLNTQASPIFPEEPEIPTYYYIFPLVCGLGGAAVSIFLKFFGKRITPYMNGFWFFIFATFYNGFILTTKNIKPNEHTLPTTFKDFGMLIFQGGCVFGFQNYLALALKYERRASLVSVLLNSQVLFVFIMDILLLGNSPTLTSLLGAVIVCGAAIMITLSKEQLTTSDAINQVAGTTDGLNNTNSSQPPEIATSNQVHRN
jgi:drug/metabolite transporter (DMT)-like permease